MSNKVTVSMVIDLNSPLDRIGKERLREYVRSSVTNMRGSLLPDDEMFGAIGSVRVKDITLIRSAEEAKAAGGNARAETLTPEERSAIASKAAAARWAKAKKKTRVRERK